MSDYAHLSFSEREEIALLLKQGIGINSIGRAIGRPGSTISREVARNGLSEGRYKPTAAHGDYHLRRERLCKLEIYGELQAMFWLGCLRVGAPSKYQAACASAWKRTWA